MGVVVDLLRRWPHRVPPLVADGVLGYLVAMAVGVAVVSSQRPAMSAAWPAYLFAFGFGVVLLWRRRQPVPVLLLTAVGICVYYSLDYPPIGLALPLAAALFSAAEHGRLRLGIAVAAALVALASYFQLIAGRDAAQLLGYEVPPVAALMGAAMALGDGVRSRRLLRAVQRDRERQARLELQHQAAEERAAERLWLARDLHDTLGHHLSVILLHAAVAAEAIPADGGGAQSALREVRRVGREAMAELRGTVIRLRSLDTGPEVAVPGGRDRLAELVERARRSGLTVHHEVDVSDVPEDVAAAAYLITQEAVTNVIRHAQATAVAIEVRRNHHCVAVIVDDNGHGAGPIVASGTDVLTGHGIRGMRERAHQLGGRLRVIDRGPGHGTRVQAELPLPAGPHLQAAT